MSRSYGKKLLDDMSKVTEMTAGVALGQLCVKANIPVAHIAVALEATRMTVYSWFRGSEIRKKNRRRIEALVSLMQDDFAKGVLPVNSDAESRRYIESLIGHPV